MAAAAFSRLVRFVPKSNPAKILIGEPVDASIDVGVAVYQRRDVTVNVFTGSSILSPGQKHGRTEVIETLLAPLGPNEVGTIRCIGLNYYSHAAEMGLDIPKVPTLFLKPASALSNPCPAPTVLPKITQQDNTGDYEAEMAVIIGRNCKNATVEEALDYVLGYTAANDVSSRTSQMNQSQWLLTVNTAPERAKRLIGRVVERLQDRYTIIHVDNCERIDEVENKVQTYKPDLLFCASMWTAEEADTILGIGKRLLPNIRTHAIPYGLQVEQGPDAVVDYLEKEIPKLLDG
ncbi:Fumarylacetoacetase protein [Niveomyces insectorum RCEF 264]|uniref:Fumarylacetoacetase protein n=1 Tax=Niveomyces insectorum RCEF 264 TaxID=1081102 RepID=A0A167Z0P1_9HYPO|nr:Fumarylacetoacetase protein [Niveomyces insectorum RCEF 264]